MIEIKGEGGEHILIEIKGRLYPDSKDKWDSDFLKGYIKVNAEGFNAAFTFVTRSSEIEFWVQLLEKFSSADVYQVSLNTIEDHLSMTLTMDELGKVLWTVILQYPEANRSMLTIHYENTINEIDLFLNELQEILLSFPVP